MNRRADLDDDYVADDVIPTGSHFTNQYSKTDPYRGSGGMRLTFDEIVEMYALPLPLIAQVLRDALTLMRERGWTGGHGQLNSPLRGDPDKLESAQAIGLASDAIENAPHNLHMGAVSLLEGIAAAKLSQWDRVKGREFGHVADLFYRGLYRLEQSNQKKAG